MENRTRSIPFYCNLFWVLFAIVTCVESYRLNLGGVNNPGPGFFPFCGGFVVLVLSLAALFQSIAKKKKDAGETSRQGPLRWWNTVIILAAIAAFAFSLEKIGFLVNGFLFICLLLKVVEPQTWKTAIVGAVITTVAANFLFNVVFGAQLPRGVLGF
jgi:putative tricarboxylic transport membrane protein